MIFNLIQHPKHSLYKTMTNSGSKWLKTSHRGSSFHESPIGAARGSARRMCVIMDAFSSQLCAIKCKTTRFSYNLQDKPLWNLYIRLAAFRFTNKSLGSSGGRGGMYWFMVWEDLRVKILFSKVSGEYTAKGSQPLRRVCFLSAVVFPWTGKVWLQDFGVLNLPRLI